MLGEVFHEPSVPHTRLLNEVFHEFRSLVFFTSLAYHIHVFLVRSFRT
jgi:hypothetical protein